MSQGRPSERVDVISTSDPESASIPVEFQTSVQEKGTSTSAQLHCVNSYQDKCGKDMQGSDEGKKFILQYKR